MIKYFSIVLLFLSLVSSARQNDSLEKELQEALKTENLTGAVWSIVSDNKISTGTIGLKNAKLGEKLNDASKVQIGSVTKTLIALGILRLASQKKLDLESAVETHLTNIIFDNPWKETTPVTIRDLLNHTSGLEDARFWQIFSQHPAPNTPLEFVFTKDPSVLKVRTKPGTRFSYSNMGYTMLGLIIDNITGQAYEKHLDENLLIPLGMKNSTFQYVSQEGVNADKDLAMGHFDDGTTQNALPSYLRPAGQFTTTGYDMALLAKFLMGNGILNKEVFIKKKWLSQMGKPTSTESYKNGLHSGYQFGLSYRDRYGVIGYYHSGNIIGYVAKLYLFPDEQKAFFISFNTDSETADYQKFNTILINHLGIEQPQKVPFKNTLPIDLEDIKGYYKLNPVRFSLFSYADLLFNSIKIEDEGKNLKVRSIQSKSYILSPVGNHLFRKQDRIKASHVFFRKNHAQLISDGLVTYEKTPFFHLGILWLSLILGVLGITIIIIKGLFLLLRKRLFKKNQIILIPFLFVIGLLIPVPFLLNQPFIALGDFTFANFLLTMVTGFLPIAMAFGLYKKLVNRQLKNLAKFDSLMIVFVLQWTIVLIFWGMIPFRLWIS